MQHPPHRLLTRIRRYVRVDASERSAQAAGQHDVGVAAALGVRAVGGKVGAVGDGVAEVGEVGEGGGLDRRFIDLRHGFILRSRRH